MYAKEKVTQGDKGHKETGMADQRALPDQLAHIRARINALEAEENAIRNILIADPSTRIGGDYIAEIKDIVTYRIVGKELEKASPDLYLRLAKETVARQVRLIRRQTGEDM